MQFNKIAIIFNPIAGSSCHKKLDQLVHLLSSAGAQIETLPTTAVPHSATDLASHAVTERTDLIIAFGGDGTVRQVASALIGTQTPLAVFPGGTSNVFARSFYSRPSAARFADMVATGQSQPIDLIHYKCSQANGETIEGLALVAVAFGDLSDAIAATKPSSKRTLGELAYVLNVFKAGIRPTMKRASFKTYADQHSKQISIGLALNTAPPPMMALSRGCNASDGLMDIVAVQGSSFLQLLKTALWVTAGKAERAKRYHRQRTAFARINFDEPVLLNIDGDVGPSTTKLELTVLPGAVNVLLS